MAVTATGGLNVSPLLAAFIEAEALPGTGVAPAQFWDGLAGLVASFAPRNRALLDRRDALQAQIDAWHDAHRGKPDDAGEYLTFLTGIGYLAPLPPPFSVGTANVDPRSR